MRSDSHLIFAFNQNPETCVQNKTLREDLYYRVSGLVIKMPPLRERESDIPLIVNHFIKKRFPDNPIQISDEAMAFLRGQYWPGNIRQLQNVLLSAQLFSDDNHLDIEALRNAYAQSDLLQIMAESSASFMPATALTLIEAEDFQIIRVLRISQGNKTRAAELLNVNRGTLDRKLTGMLTRKTLPEDLLQYALPE
jgi:transcriptional regulator with PAS, ATPase and Fis domain